MSSFNDIHWDLILTIFSFLTLEDLVSAGCVCKLWLELCQRSSLYKHIALHSKSSTETNASLKWISRGKEAVSQLTLEECEDTMRILTYAAEHCPNLRDLNITYRGEMPFSVVELLTDNCSRIQKLKLKYIKFPGVNVAQFSKLKQLKVFHLIGCKIGTIADISQLMAESDFLEDLKLVYVFTFTYEGRCTGALSSDAIYSIIASRGATLKKLVLDEFITDENLLQLSSTCGRLHSIGLNIGRWGKRSVTENGLRCIFSMNLLQKLQLQEFSHIPNASWCNIIRSSGLKNLEHLHFDGMDSAFDDMILKAISDKFPHLLSLTLSYCDNITDEGVETLIQKCTKLKWLFIPNFFNITESCLSSIPDKLVDLVLLDLGGHPGISKAIIENLENRMPCLTVMWRGHSRDANRRILEQCRLKVKI